MTTTVTQVTPFHEYAENVMNLRYSHDLHNRKETWSEICTRVCNAVLNASPVRIPSDIKDGIYRAMIERKFIPGGRILSQAGRKYHQTDSCFTLQAEDTREGWAELTHKSSLMF